MKSEKKKIVVLKFGSSVLTSEKDLPLLVHEIYREWRSGARVLVVVSAIGNQTNELVERARSASQVPDENGLAALLATGELSSAALLSLALDNAGIPVRLLDPAQAGLLTRGSLLDAELISANQERLIAELETSVVVLPGFIGRNSAGETSLLGRGGSDFTALFLASLLDAECILLKDVDGLYTCDPASNTASPLRYAEASYDTVCRVGPQVVQPKSVGFAAGKRLQFTIRTLAQSDGTRVGPFRDRISVAKPRRSPFKVGILGCGTVGGGVVQRIHTLSQFFSLAGVGVRDLGKARPVEATLSKITGDPGELIDSDCEVIVELIGGTDTAYQLVKRALLLRRHVITANKALIASHGTELRRIAADHGVQLLYSAAVGGAVPALEALTKARREGKVKRLMGVLNGTTNFVLDRLAQGAELNDAVDEARRAGYAEADPTLDLNGTDAAQKLTLLADAAFGHQLATDSVRRRGITEVDPQLLKGPQIDGTTIRLVASLEHSSGRIEANVEPCELTHDHPLASTRGAENRLVIEFENGERVCISGKGAGRWPTAEAVIADLLDLYRSSESAIEVPYDELEERVA
jgi:homoserine dehydrogenase